jgi:biotin carboxyl carrier protein
MTRIELESPVTGVVWKVAAGPRSTVAAGDTVVIVESMKMEIPVEATEAGTVAEVLVAEGDQVSEDDPVAVIETD